MSGRLSPRNYMVKRVPRTEAEYSAPLHTRMRRNLNGIAVPHDMAVTRGRPRTPFWRRPARSGSIQFLRAFPLLSKMLDGSRSAVALHRPVGAVVAATSQVGAKSRFARGRPCGLVQGRAPKQLLARWRRASSGAARLGRGAPAQHHGGLRPGLPGDSFRAGPFSGTGAPRPGGGYTPAGRTPEWTLLRWPST